MKKYVAKVEVSLKPGHSNPEGETVAYLLKELGYSVETVAVSKIYSITLTASSSDEVQVKVEEMSKRLLANPTKDNYTISISVAVVVE